MAVSVLAFSAVTPSSAPRKILGCRGCTCARNGELSSFPRRATKRRQRSIAPVQMAVRVGPASENALYSSEIGVGTISWGDKDRGYGETFARRDVEGAVEYLLANGVNFFDTAEVYGYRNISNGESSEQLLGDAVTGAQGGAQALLSTKFFPLPWTNVLVGGGLRLGRAAVLEALRASLTRLGVAAVDLYVIHFPWPYFGGESAVVDGFADAYNLGLVRAVGVSNYNDPASLKRIHAAFAARGVPLASNQIRYSLLDRSAQSSGLLDTAKELDVTIFSYEPLAKGLLTGKFTENLASPGRRFTLQQLNFYRPLTSLMKLMGAMEGRGNTRSITEVALGYIVSKGIVPIVGIKTEGQAREIVSAMDPKWKMSSEFVQVLDEKADYLAKQQR